MAARARKPKLDLDALFTVPPGEFIAQRNALVKELSDAGRDDDARTVKQLKKPSMAIWAINQAVRAHPEEVRRLLDAAQVLRKAQRAALTDHGRDELEAAAKRSREMEQRLSGYARAAVKREGANLASSAVDIMRDTFRAIPTASDDEIKAFAEGQLTAPLVPAQMEDVLALMRGGPRARRKKVAVPEKQHTVAPPKPDRRAERARRQKHHAAHQRALQAERRARSRARVVMRDAVKKERAAERARRALEKAERDAEAARAAAREAEGLVEKMRSRTQKTRSAWVAS